MGFSLKWLIPPFLFISWTGSYGAAHPRMHNIGALYFLGFTWGFLACAVVVVYWIVRIARRATSDHNRFS